MGVFDKRFVRNLYVLKESDLIEMPGISFTEAALYSSQFILQLPNIRYNVKTKEGNNILNTMKILHDFLSNWKNNVNLKGLESSSHDYSQTIHLTLDTSNLNNFWSSSGSNSKDSTEWLSYKIEGEACLISSVSVSAFQALFHTNDPIYPPSKVRFLVGMIPNQFHYTSPLFDYQQNSSDQFFHFLPEVVVGKYLKFEMYGKPQMQSIDSKYYIALQKVSCQGCPVNSSTIPEAIKPTVSLVAENLFSSEVLKLRNTSGEEVKNLEEFDNISEEEFEKTEDILIALAKKEATLIDIMEEHKIDDFLEWLTTRRVVLQKSEKILEHIVLPTDPFEIPEIRQKRFRDSEGRYISLYKLIMWYVYKEYNNYGIWDEVNTEIFIRTLMQFKHSQDDFLAAMIILRFENVYIIKSSEQANADNSIDQEESAQGSKSSKLIEKYFRFNPDFKENAEAEIENKNKVRKISLRFD